MTASYDGVEILRDVSLTIGRNEVVSVLGRNGVGKSTLVNAIFNIGPDVSGDIDLYGQPVARLPAYRIARLGIALVPQGRGVFPDLLVEENLRLATLRRRAGARRWTLERVYDVFPRLAERRDSSSSALSGGERQLLAIARALLTEAEFLVLDEPSEGLAPMAIGDIAGHVSNFAKLGLTVLIVEQNIPLALKLATRAIVLAHGMIVYDGSPGDLLADTAFVRENLGV